MRSVAADEAQNGIERYDAVHKVTDETNFPPVLHFDPSLQMSVACPQLVEWLKTEKGHQNTPQEQIKYNVGIYVDFRKGDNVFQKQIKSHDEP